MHDPNTPLETFAKARAWERNQIVNQIGGALRQFRDGNGINDILLPGFNQHGKWVGLFSQAIGDENKKRLERLPPQTGLLYRTQPDGTQTFMGSWFHTEETPLELPFHHVVGQIHAPKTTAFSAPNLKTLESDLDVAAAQTVFLPELESAKDCNFRHAHHLALPNLKKLVGSLRGLAAKKVELPLLEITVGEFTAWTVQELSLPSLRLVHGGFTANVAKKVHLPALERVGDKFRAPEADIVIAPKLEVVDNGLDLPMAHTVKMPRLKYAKSINCERAPHFYPEEAIKQIKESQTQGRQTDRPLKLHWQAEANHNRKKEVTRTQQTQQDLEI